MMDMGKNIGLGRVALFCWLLATNIVLVGQNSQPLSDTDQMMVLMKKLADHSVSANSLVDPTLGSKQRQKILGYFSDQSYQMTFVPVGTARVNPDGRAVVPMRIHFRNLTSQVDGKVDIRFIQRGGVWYFADFDFLGWTPFEIVMYIGGMGFAIAFAIGVVTLRRRLWKQNMLKGSNLIKIFIPIFWPKLFSDTRVRRV